MQGTVRGFDPASRSGSVFLDDGTVVEFGATVFAGSGLRLLRPGQRVAVGREPGGVIVSLTLATFPLPGDGAQDAPPGAPSADAGGAG